MGNKCEQVEEKFEKKWEMVREKYCERLKLIWENAMGNIRDQMEVFEKKWEMVRER